MIKTSVEINWLRLHKIKLNALEGVIPVHYTFKWHKQTIEWQDNVNVIALSHGRVLIMNESLFSSVNLTNALSRNKNS